MVIEAFVETVASASTVTTASASAAAATAAAEQTIRIGGVWAIRIEDSVVVLILCGSTDRSGRR